MLTFKQPGWYLNASAWFTENVLLEQNKQIQLWNKNHFAYNTTDYPVYLKHAVQISVMPIHVYIILISRNVFYVRMRTQAV